MPVHSFICNTIIEKDLTDATPKGSAYISMLDDSDTGYLLIEFDNDDSSKAGVKYINPAFESITGLKVADMMGKAIDEAMRWICDDDDFIVVNNGKTLRKEQVWLKKTDKFINAKLFFPEVNLLSILVNDITSLANCTIDLAASQKKIETIINAVPMPICALDNNYKLEFCNQEFFNIWTYMFKTPPTEGFDFAASGNNQINERWGEKVRKALSGEESQTEEMIKMYGQEMRYLTRIRPMMGDKCEIIGVLIASTDITDKHNAYSALKESEEKFKTLSEQVPVGVYRTDYRGSIIHANSVLVKMLGYSSQEEFLRVNVLETFPNPDIRKQYLKGLTRSHNIMIHELELFTKSGEIIWVRDSSKASFNAKGRLMYIDGIMEDIMIHELELFTKNGEIIWVRDSSKASFNAKGRLTYIDGIMEDITSIKSVNEELKHKEESLRKLLENSQDLIFMLDANGKFIYFNGSSSYKMKQEDVINRTPYDIFSEDLADEIFDDYMTVRISGEPIRKDMSYQAKNQKFYFNESIYPIKDTDGKIRAVGIIGRNINDRINYQNQLIESQKELETLMDAIPAFVFYKDTENKIVRANQAYADYIGITKDQLIGQCVLDIYSDKESAQNNWLIDKEILSGNIEHKSYIHKIHNDKIRWFKTDKFLRKDANGNPLGIICYSVDITDIIDEEQEISDFD